jgi:hypothetical protein
MLDEANVGRFRSMLESLADLTQIVIITHNRGTIEAANTIYGISMGADSVSQVISRQMDGNQPRADGTQPRADGTQPRADGTQPRADGTQSNADGR